MSRGVFTACPHSVDGVQRRKCGIWDEEGKAAGMLGNEVVNNVTALKSHK